jgi:uncharacterized membrane protein YhaH (DUF805 family)
MGFGKAIASCLKKYIWFGGRASRSEYWYFQLLFWASIAAMIAMDAMFPPAGLGQISTPASAAGIVMLLLLLPWLAVSVRRLHDIERTGWWILFGFAPGGAVVILVFAVMKGTDGQNFYGPDPLVRQRLAYIFD